MNTGDNCSAQKLSIVAILVLGIMTGNAALSIAMLVPAFPAIAMEFGASEASVQMTLSTFLIGFTIGQLFYGPVTDKFGRRPIVLLSLSAYGLSSLFCALSNDIESLIVLRFVQGLAGASGAILGRAIIRDVYSGPRLLNAMSMLFMVLTAAPMISPLIGSMVLDMWGWRSVFWSHLVYSGLWIVLAWVCIPETLPKEKRKPIHPTFIIQNFRNILSHKNAIGYSLTACFGYAGMFVFIAASPFIYMEFYSVSPFEYSLLYAANVVAMAVVSFLNGKLAGFVSGDTLINILTVLMLVASIVLLVCGLTETGGILGIVVPMFFYIGCVGALGAGCVSGKLQFFGHIAGTASSIFGTLQYGMGAVSGILVSYFSSGTPMTMCLMVLVFSILTIVSFHLLAKRQS